MRKTLLIALLIASAVAGIWFGEKRFRLPELPGPTLRVIFLNVSEGESVLVQTPDGRAALVDCGGPADGEAISESLRHYGVRRLDMLVLTSAETNRIGGAPAVLQSVPITHVLDSPTTRESTLRKSVLDEIAEQKIPYKTASAGQVFSLGETAEMKILLPIPNTLTAAARSANNDAVVARVSFGSVNVLLLGDIGLDQENRLVSTYRDLSCDVVKIAGSGDRDTTSNELLRLAKPAYAVICAGPESGRGRLHKETLRRLQASGVRVKRTDKNGVIVVATNGRTLRVWSER